MGADPDADRRGDQVTLVVGEVEPDPVGGLGGEGPEHRGEVRDRPRREVVPARGDEVQLVEGRQVLGGAMGDDDTRLRRLLDVAAPQLVHPGEDGVGIAVGERELEDVPRLAHSEPGRVLVGRPPPERPQLVGHGDGGVVGVIGRYVTEDPGLARGQGGLDGPRTPAAGDDRRAHPDAERALAAEMLGERCQPATEVGVGPVDHRPFGQIRERTPHLGQPAVEHQPGAEHLVAVGVVDPADGLGAPLPLHLPPGRGLQEAGRLLGGEECQMFLGSESTNAQNHAREATRPDRRSRAACRPGSRSLPGAPGRGPPADLPDENPQRGGRRD